MGMVGFYNRACVQWPYRSTRSALHAFSDLHIADVHDDNIGINGISVKQICSRCIATMIKKTIIYKNAAVY